MIGAGGHAASLTETIHALGLTLKLVVDPNSSAESDFRGIATAKTVPDTSLRGTESFVIAVGDNYTRKSLRDTLLRGVPTERLAILIHPSASVSTTASIAHGSVVLQNAVIGTSARLEEGCIVNSGAIVEHECVLHAYSSLGPGSTLGGRTRIGGRSAVSIGATVAHGLDIGNDTIVGASAYVHRDLPDRVVAYGIPATVRRSRAPSDRYLG